MAQLKSQDGIPDLRDLLKENDGRLLRFCQYLLPPDYPLEDFVLGVFREFGEIYRRAGAAREGRGWVPLEIRIRLFRIAWERLRAELLTVPFTWTVGRDTRPMKGMDDDLLEQWSSAKSGDNSALAPRAVERLRRLDTDFRAPVVLRDILGFDDEEVVRILGTRWGVFRHRLHRGRLEFRAALKGFSKTPDPAGSTKEVSW
jgi:hypothetical protein